MRYKKHLNVILGGILVLMILLMMSPFVQVGAGERGIVLRFGAVEDRILDEGLHFVIPFMETVQKVDVKIRKLDVEAPSYSHDTQNVHTRIALNYHVDATRVNKLWKELGRDFEDRIVKPAVQESVKAITAQYTAAQLIEQRARVRDEIKAILHERLGGRFLIVDEFSIVDFEFSDTYEHAIEEKQVAQQQALKASNELQRIKIEAEQRVATATAEAESIRIQAQALLQNPHLVQLEAVKKWDGKMPQYMMGGEGALPFVNITPSREGSR
ncbi:MAG: prohibitin family protein [Deltaproteobacteria bacterium]|nr:prohibitin family protein [Deltaproteobacteria bacterium]